MRLTNIEIKDIHRGLYRDDINTNSKLLVLNLEEGEPIIIFLGVGRRRFPIRHDCTLETQVPLSYLHQAHIAITYDYLLRDFNIVKHRFGADGIRFNSINQINEVLSQQFIELGFGLYDAYHIISKICICFGLTTGETIFFSRQSPYGCTMYDLHINGENTTDSTRYFGGNMDTITPIKIKLKHNFLD